MPSFYLDDHKRALIESNQIEFTSAAAPVCFHRQQSSFGDLSTCGTLAPSTNAIFS
jgi:hypothetical protein